ncbi:hypothetical protein HYC85_015539 [Camellia sinensis]|uniref:Uncharacterized protein n=1 Tax=Camellia sinensis TaxID=4442 RepID=A0A7J7GZB2_CAMSI|nr:hypothetical protein HYC85_015539 [Camellia sinensis]
MYSSHVHAVSKPYPKYFTFRMCILHTCTAIFLKYPCFIGSIIVHPHSRIFNS